MAWTVVRREAATMLKINKVAFLDLQLMFCKLAPVKHRIPVSPEFVDAALTRNATKDFVTLEPAEVLFSLNVFLESSEL